MHPPADPTGDRRSRPARTVRSRILVALLIGNVAIMAYLLMHGLQTSAPMPTDPGLAPSTPHASGASSVNKNELERVSAGERKLLLYWRWKEASQTRAVGNRAQPSGAEGLLQSDAASTERLQDGEARKLLEEARDLFESDKSSHTYAGRGIYRHRHDTPLPLYSAYLYAAYCTAELDGQKALRSSLREKGVPPALYGWWFHDLSRMPRIVGGLWYFRCLQYLEQVQWALLRYADDHEGRFPTDLRALEDGYLASLPHCPASEPGQSYQDGYQPVEGPTGYVLRCANHASLHTRPLEVRGDAKRFNPSLSPQLFTEFTGYKMVADGFFSTKRLSYTQPMLSALGLKAGEDVADVGCGIGVYTFSMARRVGPRGRVYAIDIEPGVLEVVRYMTQVQRTPNVQAVQSRPNDIGLPPSSIDVALMNDVFRYVIESSGPNEAGGGAHPLLSNIHRCLRRGGRLAVSDKAGGWGRLDVVRAKLSPALIRERVERAGFVQVSHTPLGSQSERFMLVFRKR